MAFVDMAANEFIRTGVWDLILPFILIFAIVFAIMQKAKIFGDKEAKRYNIAISLVMGLLVVIPHILGIYPPYKDPVTIMQQALPNVGIVLVAILMALLIIGLLGSRVQLGGNSLSGWIALLAFLIILFIFGSAAGWWYAPTWLWFLLDPNMASLVIVILVFAVIIWFITHEPKDNEPKDDSKKFGGKLAELLKGPND